jgi:hypothetical protein
MSAKTYHLYCSVFCNIAHFEPYEQGHYRLQKCNFLLDNDAQLRAIMECEIMDIWQTIPLHYITLHYNMNAENNKVQGLHNQVLR